ncbi:MAG: uroporphyrinogen decarboxylase family protein [Clostridia bacterium]
MFEYVLLDPVASVLLGKKFVDYSGSKNEWDCFVKETGWDKALHLYAENRVKIAVILGHDLMCLVPNPLPPVSIEGNADLEYNRKIKILEETDDPVERLKRRNDVFGTTQSIHEDSYIIYSYVKEEMQKQGIDIPILAPAYYHGVWDDIDLMQTMIIEPEIAHTHFSIATKKALSAIDKYSEFGIDQFGIGGDFAGNRLIISPESYKKFIVPELCILSNHIHAGGGWAINASDGNLWPVIEDFLINSGVDGYLEIDMRAEMDLAKLKRMYGDRITFYGNMDCGEILSFCTVEEIKKYTAACITAGLGNGGHIFCASNAITATVSLDNYIAMVNEYKDMFNLPQISLF